jgi:hypothetical protein
MRQAKTLHGWNKSRVIAIALLIAAIVLVDQMTGENAIGFTFRFLWGIITRFVIFAIHWSDILFLSVLRVRVFQWIGALTMVQIGYIGRVIFNEHQMGKFSNWKGSMKEHVLWVKRLWRATPFLFKVAVVGLLIFGQMALLPRLSEWVILFPMGFMLHGIESLYRRMFGKVANKAIDRVIADKHEELVDRIEWLDRLYTRCGLWRLRYLTAWRLWKHSPKYRDPVTLKRKKSFIEPLRLFWRSDESLERYIGKPLFAYHAGRPKMK